MRILHYYLGPHRQGGLNRYANDLAAAQVKSGDDVFALYPVGKLLPPRRAKIKKSKPFSGVQCFELYGGTPVPLFEGIRDVEEIIAPPEKERLSAQAVRDFCDEINVEVFHIHTLMGLPIELFKELKARNVTIVFTTHDYFGLCPKVNFIDRQGKMCCARNNGNCSLCNCDAPGRFFLELRNSSFLMKLKPIVKFALGSLRRGKTSATPQLPEKFPIRDYEKLFRYYRDILLACDQIHFNSENSKNRFLAEIPELSGQVIPISHAGIVDNKVLHQVENGFFKLLFIGSASPYKGLPTLLEALKELSAQGIDNWHLDVWGCDQKALASDEKICCHGFFAPGEEEKIFADADLLIVPSIWEETFGFVIPEALGRGLPAVCSDLVGAKMLLPDEMIYHGTANLPKILEKLIKNPYFFNKISNLLYQNAKINTMLYHIDAIRVFYQFAKNQKI